MKKLPLIHTKNTVVQELKNELIVYDLKKYKAFCLNETSKFIWNLCDGKHSITDITDKLTKNFGKPVSEDIVYLAISQFEKDGLVANENSEFADHFNGMSRREVIRKVGFASIIALPIVSSVVAPSAAMAQSGLSGVEGSCSTTTDCQPGLTCKSCPSCGGGSPACCRNSSPSRALGAGQPFANAGSLMGQAACDSGAIVLCCSRSGTFVSQQSPTQTNCVCN